MPFSTSGPGEVTKSGPLKEVIELHVSNGHRWGPGKTHISGGPYRDTLCREYLNGTRNLGYIDHVTCLICLSMGRNA